jgi:hypothetical protein
MNELDSLTQPAGPLAEVRIWGHPYHGLVTAPGTDFTGIGTLARGGGYLMDYRMPRSADAWKIQLDGVPAVVRDSGQAAADALIGYTWLSSIVVSGTGQVWGKDPGSNSPCWYWRDAAGKVWRAQVQNTGPTGGLLTQVVVDVRPFGRFGAGSIAARSTTLTHGLAIQSDLWALLGGTLSNDVRPVMHDIKPDGSAALFSISCMQASQFEVFSLNDVTYKVPCPFGFFSIALATGGDGWPVPSLTLLKTHEDALGAHASSDTYENDSSRVPAGPSSRWQGTSIATQTFTIAGRVASMMYDGAGVDEVTLSFSRDEAHSSNYVVNDLGGGLFTHVDNFSFSVDESVSGLYAGASFVSEGGSESGSGTTDLVPIGDIDLPGPLGIVADIDRRIASHLLPIGRQIAGDLVEPHAYTARAYGSIRRAIVSTGVGAFTYGTVHYPGGTTSGGSSETTSAHPSLYRSFNPVTGTLSARSAVSVCYV